MAKTTLWPNKQPLPSSGRSFLRGFSLSLRSSNAKRKSAVELLAESKCHYVKSEAVLDSKQEFKHSEHLHVSSTANRLSFTSLLKSRSSAGERVPPPIPQRRSTGSAPPVPRRSPPSSLPITTTSGNKNEKVTSVQARPRPKTPSFNERDAQTPAARPRPKTPSFQESQTPQPNRRNNKDIQMQLRRLLGADSRDNLLVPDSSPIRPSKPVESSQSIHKSMPDLLSNTGDIDDEEDVVRTTKSVESRSRATSDYVSRTPSARLDSISNHVSDMSLSDEDDDEEDDDDDEIKPFEPLGKPILRSKSDISYRFSRPSPPVADPVKRRESCGECGAKPESLTPPDVDTVQVEEFFESMGMDAVTLKTVKQPSSNHSSPVFFDQDSSLDSLSSSGPRRRGSSDSMRSTNGRTTTNGGGGGGGGGGLTDKHLKAHSPADTSIVERNARVIKWLLHCRRIYNEPLPT